MTSKKGKGLRTVECGNNKQKLSFIPEELPAEVQLLQLKGNVIGSVQSQLSRCLQLREIDLSFNDLANLEPSPVFGNLTLLRYLSLEHNKLYSLSDETFTGLDNLNELILADNVIDEIEPHSFSGLSQLRTLSLKGNKLSGLNPQWFVDLTNLDSLLLSDNFILEIPDGTFDSLSHLTKLSLANNKLRALNKMAFKGMRQLQSLDLSGNRFTEIPSLSLTAFTKLRMLILDKNPIHRLGMLDMRNIFITEIHLNNMLDLITVDTDAFYDLEDLTVLHLHDNPKLMYVDPVAFHNVPKLASLFLHNNSLMALPTQLLSSLPSLATISVYGNPLRCDCNIRWIKQLLTNGQNRSIIFQDSDRLQCDTPTRLNSKFLKDVPLTSIPKVCSPTVIPFFQDSYQRQLGDRITFECRGIGEPQPHIHWILSNNKVVNNTSNISRIRLDTSGSLSLDHLKSEDAGTYTCVATNANGYDTTSAVLRVHNQDIHILYRGIATNFVTVTWNGTSSTVATSNYLILYRKAGGAASTYRSVHIRPFMREYTVSNLKPETTYEFCIAYQHGTETTTLDCMQITTKHQSSIDDGITTIKKTTVGLAFGVVIMSLVLLCVTVALVKRYRRRKSYQEPSGKNEMIPQASSSKTVNFKVGHMSQIPLDNLYHPPSTPLYTSRTNLIGGGTSA